MDPYLYHFGVKGMHWGIRRFQNQDGSLTAQGKKRYGVLSNPRTFSLKGKHSENKSSKARMSNGKKLAIALGTVAVAAAVVKNREKIGLFCRLSAVDLKYNGGNIFSKRTWRGIGDNVRDSFGKNSIYKRPNFDGWMRRQL